MHRTIPSLIAAALLLPFGGAALAAEGGSAPASLAVPGDQAALEAILSGPGCPFSSAQRKALACIEAPLDMGFTTISLVGLDEKGNELARFVLYADGSTGFDAKALRPDGIREANEWLKGGAFVRSAEALDLDKARVEAKGDSLGITTSAGAFRGALPPVDKADRPEGYTGEMKTCARWQPESAWLHEAAGLAGVRLTLATTFQNTDPKAACYAKTRELNDETYLVQSRFVVLASEKP